MDYFVSIISAQKQQAPDIAKLIMTAMSEDCCAYFYGEQHTAEDFHLMLTELVEMEHSQYSYRNTILALADERIAGIAVSYDGSLLHDLRTAFIAAAKHYFDRDFSQMDDETEEGELYLDSFAVLPAFRKRGIGSRLLQATVDKAQKLKLPCVGLLVDEQNPAAERLYLANGFHLVDTSSWGGHRMKHLQTASNVICV